MRSLAGKSSGPISMSDLRGKSSIIREPLTGDYYKMQGGYLYPKPGDYFYTIFYISSGVSYYSSSYWNGTRIDGPVGTDNQIRVGDWVYHRGTLRVSFNGGGHYGIYRVKV